MIQGVRIDVKGEELLAQIGARITHHQSKAQAHKQVRRKREHEELAAALTFVRDHLVPDETYRLDDGDLHLLDLVHEGFTRWPRW